MMIDEGDNWDSKGEPIMDQNGQYDPNDPNRQYTDDRADATNPAGDTSNEGLVGRPSGTGAGASGLAGSSSFDPALSPAHQGLTGSQAGADAEATGVLGQPSGTGAGAAGVAGSSSFDPADSPANQGRAGSPSFGADAQDMRDPNSQRYDPRQGGSQRSDAPNDPDQGMDGQSGNQGYDSTQSGGQNLDPNQDQGY
jgi:hypothetical protein